MVWLWGAATAQPRPKNWPMASTSSWPHLVVCWITFRWGDGDGWRRAAVVQHFPSCADHPVELVRHLNFLNLPSEHPWIHVQEPAVFDHRWGRPDLGGGLWGRAEANHQAAAKYVSSSLLCAYVRILFRWWHCGDTTKRGRCLLAWTTTVRLRIVPYTCLKSALCSGGRVDIVTSSLCFEQRGDRLCCSLQLRREGLRTSLASPWKRSHSTLVLMMTKRKPPWTAWSR